MKEQIEERAALELEARERAAVAEVVTAVLRHDLRNRFSSIRDAAYYLMRETQKAELWKADPRAVEAMPDVRALRDDEARARRAGVVRRRANGAALPRVGGAEAR